MAREDVPGESARASHTDAFRLICTSPHASFLLYRPAFRRVHGPERVRSVAVSATINGKIDRSALPAPDATNTLQDRLIIAPRTIVEERLSAILCRLLHLESLSMEDNFFMLGGHSLLGTQLIARIRDAFGVEITLRVLFDNATVAGSSGGDRAAHPCEVEQRSLRLGREWVDAYAPGNQLWTATATPSRRRPAPAELYQLLDPVVLADPYPLFRRLRRGPRSTGTVSTPGSLLDTRTFSAFCMTFPLNAPQRPSNWLSWDSLT